MPSYRRRGCAQGSSSSSHPYDRHDGLSEEEKADLELERGLEELIAPHKEEWEQTLKPWEADYSQFALPLGALVNSFPVSLIVALMVTPAGTFFRLSIRLMVRSSTQSIVHR
jgi:hypothetical protein